MENIRQVSNFIKKIEPRNIVVRNTFNSKAKSGTIRVLIRFDVDDNLFRNEFRERFGDVGWYVFFEMSGQLAKITDGNCEFFVRFVSPKINLPEFSSGEKSAPC